MSDETNTTAGSATEAPQSDAAGAASAGTDLQWVWREVRKRVFIKLPFSLGLADAMEAVVPITLDDDTFVCGLSTANFSLSNHLVADQVRNTIENILRQAAQRYIRLEVIEGTALSDWQTIKQRRERAQEAVIAMAERSVQEHHFEDVLNQIVSEIRQRVTAARDRVLPQVRAQLLLDIVPSLADAQEMLFNDPDEHDARRAMARALDRIASFLEVPPVTLAIEVERYRRSQAGLSHSTTPRQKAASQPAA
jgi:hypothetical protein